MDVKQTNQTNPVRMHYRTPIKWVPFDLSDLEWVQRFFSLLPGNPELKHFKGLTPTELYLSDSGEGQYDPTTDEFVHRKNDMMTVGAYTIVKSITIRTIETIVSTEEREVFVYTVTEPVHTYSSSRWEPDDFDVAEIGEAESVGDAVKIIFLREYEHLFDMAAEAISIEKMMREQEQYYEEYEEMKREEVYEQA